MKIKTEPLKRRKGTGKAFPVRLKQTEISRVIPRVTSYFDSWRCRMVLSSRKLLLYADAAWLGGGHAAWAVSLGCDAQLGNSVTTGRVEALGPFNHSEPITSSRAELRAVIAALRLSDWKAEGFKSINVATGSTYVTGGVSRVKRWRDKGWKRKRGKDVSDRDLWELLLGETERWKDQDVEVCVLGVPREVTVETGKAASAAARKLQDQARFTDVALDPLLEAKNQPERVTIIIALGGNDLSPNSWQSTLLPMAQERSAETPERALKLLSGPPPAGIFIADAAITRHREVLERIIDAMHKGAKVVVGGVFASTVTPLEFARFFTILGLLWERAYPHRAPLYLRPGVLYRDSTVRLPRELMDKMYFIESVKESENWYTFTGNPAEHKAAVAYTTIGAGAFGFVGCVSHERGAINIARVMLGETL
ncbi:uncharacterized protein FIESC28_10839 [Fusarium coffeatum]|uniref:RNase H type-1 domain-containing protein n=1 Tax=Fusarium coffeatum TaxID=231269 RepID=A0A366QQF2_9HYPO|nr:uncharacterized protein FIESC28_10839 [Fusarium coffeatum]RBR07093.1 hypothetical protein FIESC28_10839 [Fusarium coffeatum]